MIVLEQPCNYNPQNVSVTFVSLPHKHDVIRESICQNTTECSKEIYKIIYYRELSTKFAIHAVFLRAEALYYYTHNKMVYKQQDNLPSFGYNKEIIFHSIFIQLYFIHHLSTVIAYL